MTRVSPVAGIAALAAVASAQTATIDVPFFGITSQPMTGNLLYAESSTTIIELPSTVVTEDMYYSRPYTYTYTNAATMTIAPKLGAWRYEVSPDYEGYGEFALFENLSNCWLHPDASASTTSAICSYYADEEYTTTWAEVEHWPVTITSGAELLSAPKATAANTASIVTTLEVIVPWDYQLERPIAAAVLTADDSSTILRFDTSFAPFDLSDQTLTVGPSTWNWYTATDGYTETSNCPYPFTTSTGACIVSYGGADAVYPGVSAEEYYSTQVMTVTVTAAVESNGGMTSLPEMTGSAPTDNPSRGGSSDPSTINSTFSQGSDSTSLATSSTPNVVIGFGVLALISFVGIVVL